MNKTKNGFGDDEILEKLLMRRFDLMEKLSRPREELDTL